MSEFTMNLRNIENMKNDRERIKVSNFYVTNYLRENDCCISSEDWKTILFYDYDPWCLIYEIVEHWTPEKERKIAKLWWSEFEKINTDDYGHITEPFMFWPEGTDQFDIMDAFKDFFDIDVIEDKDFMGMIGFANGDYLVNTLKRKQEENKMKEETTIYFANGDKAIVHRYGINNYSIYFEDMDCSVRGTFLDVVNEIKAKEKHIETKAINNRDLTPEIAFDENNYPMVSSGTYLNYWTTEADYDVFIIFHELQIHQHDEICEKVVHQIMNHRKKTDTKEQLAKRIQTALEALVDWEECEPCVFITHMKGSDN